MLQGSLDNFALDEVLGLLASTSKTGCLEVKGDRGIGALALHQGQLVGASASNTANGSGTEDIVFELMRFAEGTFVFSPGDPESADAGRPVPDVLASAEARLADWRTIEAVVPSLNHTVSPVPALPANDITINRREWSTLIVIGSGCPVSAVCGELDLGEVEGSRQIKDLAERGLVSVGPPLSSAARAASYVARPVAAEPEPRVPADPFARKAEQTTRRVGALTAASSASAPASPAVPGAPTISVVPAFPAAGAPDLTAVGAPPPGPELVPAAPATAASAGSGAVPAVPVLEGDGPFADRPPRPAPPTAAELRQATRSNPGGRASVASVLGTGDDPGSGSGSPTSPAEPMKPGGLLMRYLKGED